MIEVRNLRKSFDGKAVLEGLTFSVGRGEVYGLLGPNGAGKTTAINILCNLLDADAGTVTILLTTHLLEAFIDHVAGSASRTCLLRSDS